MRKNFLPALCAAVAGVVMCLAGAPAEAAPDPTNVQLVDQLIAQSHDGRTVQQGDMVLNVAQLRSYRSSLVPGGRTTRSAFYRTTYWTVVGGRVPYTFDPALPQAQQDAFIEGCREWEKWANLKFVPRTNEPAYIRVYQDANGGSFSAVGMTGGEQGLSLATWANKGTACHELAHALGVMHEQSRSDRDKYVEIKFDNVDPTLAYNYAIIDDSDNHREYDFESIMHYGPWGFAIDPSKPTLVCKPGYEQYQNIIGQRGDLTELDKAGMADIYGFPPGVTATPVPTPTLPPRPTLVCDPITVAEGAAGQTTPMTYRIGLSYVPTKDVSFSYKVVRYVMPGRTEADPALDTYSATPGDDYVQISDGTITLPAATTDNNGNSTREAQITLSVIGDGKVENDESLLLVLSDPVNARFPNDENTISIKGTISNDDFGPTATATPRPTNTPLPVATPIATATPKPVATPRPTNTPKPVVPTARVSLSPSKPVSTSTVVAKVTLSPSAGTTSTSAWRIKGSLVARNVTTLNLSRYGNLKRGDIVSVEVTPVRGQVKGKVVKAQVALDNTPPVAKGTSASTLSAVPVSVALSGSDADGDALTYAVVTRPRNGTATITSAGGKSTLTYRSKVGFIGAESIGVAALDGRTKSLPATIAVQVRANTKPEVVSLSPASGTLQSLTTVTFTQAVKDAESNVASVSFIIGRSSSGADGVGMVYDAGSRTVSMISDDGKELSEPFKVGATMENERAKVILRSVSTSGGTTTLRWQITFKAEWEGVKSLWVKAVDAGTLVDGFRSLGKITLSDGSTNTTKSVNSTDGGSAGSS